MSGGTLRGDVVGASRDELVSKASAAAAVFFGMPCVRVTLIDPTTRLDGSVCPDFSAGFTAVVWHRLQVRPLGPDKCLDCGRESWPHAPLEGGAP